MATIKFGAIVVKASGKLGGHYFSYGQGGPVLSSNGSKLNTTVTRKKLWGYRKADAALNAQAWQGLTDAQRSQWASDAPNWPSLNKVGDKKTLRGYTHFLQINNYLGAIGQAPLTVPPVKAQLTKLTTLTINTLTTALMTVTAAPAYTADELIVIEATRTMSAGAKPSPKDFRIIKVIDNSVIFPYSVYNDYVSIFGAPLLDGYVNFQMTLANGTTGQKGIMVFNKKIVS